LEVAIKKVEGCNDLVNLSASCLVEGTWTRWIRSLISFLRIMRQSSFICLAL